jgi:hypothetical protein
MRLLPKGIFVAVALCALGSKPIAQTRPAGSARSEVLRGLDQTVDDVAERVLPAVVQISVSGHRMSNALAKVSLRGSAESVRE